MAIYHFSASIISGSKGASAVAAAAYQSGQSLHSEADDLVKDYSRKERVLYDAVMLPLDAPREYADRNTLWNAVEAKEGMRGQYARRIVVALPRELSLEQNIDLLKSFVRNNFTNKGMVADVAVHDDGTGNPHAHIMLTVRPFLLNGKWGQKEKSVVVKEKGPDGKMHAVCIGRDKHGRKRYKQDKRKTTDWDRKETLKKWRKEWANEANRALALAGSSARIDHRSYKDRATEDGVPEMLPQKHLGPNLAAAEARGEHTTIGDYNREVRAYNAGLKDDRNKVADAEEVAAELQRVQSQLADIYAARVKMNAAKDLLGKWKETRKSKLERIEKFEKDLSEAWYNEEKEEMVYGRLRPEMRPTGFFNGRAKKEFDRERAAAIKEKGILEKELPKLNGKIASLEAEVKMKTRGYEILNPEVKTAKAQVMTKGKTQQRTAAAPRKHPKNAR